MTHLQVMIAVVGISACWLAFALVWATGALYNVVKGPRWVRWRASKSFVAIIAAGIVVLIVVVHVVPVGDWHALQVDSPWVTGIGLAVLVLSTAFTLWARAVLGTMWSVHAVLKAHPQLRIDGPYGITRKPIYTGVIGMFVGSVLLAGVGVLVLIPPVAVAVFEVKIHDEERLMSETFPDDYPRYRRRVPQLIPGLSMRLGRA